ncbi:rho guanine nucleotide exchange factor 3 isoform X3 [Cynoglossus semilaevis]|uniref:Rho guanine nucleotide exchange factor (GEF) 3 n=1 Tax=Cynoglossus semilaevis TaxID=244447 RepID=A0A3P8WQR3_CYNSE|nr:rho guanine nucleotide exchange factor 3 isoform X3 [Cynoglossus semilaevis]
MMGCCLFVYYRKKRKQASKDADSLSLCSLDINEPSTKRSKPVSRVASLASLLPPVKTTPLKRIGLTLQRSISLRNGSQIKKTSPPPPPPSATMKVRTIAVTNPSSSTVTPRNSMTAAPSAKRRDSKLWSETFDVHLGATQPLSPKEIKRQEAIFELAQGEQDLVEDLRLAKKAYRDPMLKLSIMTEQELNQIFGNLDSLIPLHEDLLSRLRDARKPDGSTEHVGHILTDWLPCLSSYTPYCSNQVKAKSLLDQKKQDRRVQDFLQRCLQSPFSRKLDLWNFLDIPRSRLVKYPLLLREILKHTPNDHPDRQHLEEAMQMVQNVVADINRCTGESECQYYKDRLLYTEDGWKDELIDRSKTLSCHGELKNNRGLKLHVFLFQDVLVITRSLALNDQPVSYQLCRQPIPIRLLDLEDLSDGEMRVGGSIRGAFSNTERTKNFFRVSYRTAAQLQNHYFQASDAFNKQQWINCIRQAKEAAALTGDQSPITGQCLETKPEGQVGPLDRTTQILPSVSRDANGKGTCGELETGPGLEGENHVNGFRDQSSDKEAREDRTTTRTVGDMETHDCSTELELDGEVKMVDDPSPTITEDNIGKMETGLEPCHEMLGEEVTTREDQKMDEEERISDIDSDGSSMLPCAASTTQKEKQVHEEVQSDMKEEEEEQEDVMDVTEVDTVTGEELVLRC